MSKAKKIPARKRPKRPASAKRLERHYTADGEATLCGVLVTSTLLIARDRNAAPLVVTCEPCRSKLPKVKAEPLPEPKPGETGSCALCNKAGLGEGQYCFGCRRYVCEECSTNVDMPWGSHEPEAHKDPEDR